MSCVPSKKGYCAAYLSKDGVIHRHEVHRLVGEAFIGPLPDGFDTHHINGIPSDNRVENLEYKSRFLHQHHHTRGELAHKAVLTREQVTDVRHLLEQGLSQKEIAKRYGVARSTIGEINRGASWAWLTAKFDPIQGSL
jgi:DNA-binding NarL/FixJ family response regulator